MYKYAYIPDHFQINVVNEDTLVKLLNDDFIMTFQKTQKHEQTLQHSYVKKEEKR